MADNNGLNTGIVIHKSTVNLVYKCPKCDNGIDWNSMSACSFCKGKGTYSVKTPFYYSEHNFTIEEDEG